MNQNLMNLAADLDAKASKDLEVNSDNYIEGELTEEDQKTLDDMKEKSKNIVMVTEMGPDGEPVSTPVGSFLGSIDEKVTKIDEDKTIKTLNSGEINRTVEQIKNDAREHALQIYRTMANSSNKDITPDDIVGYNNAAIEVLMKEFGVSRLTADIINTKTRRMSLAQLVKLLPDEFVDLYIDEKEKLSNSIYAKNKLIAVLNYLCVTGPEMDYLNEYIDDENKLAMVSKRILQCQLDFVEMIKDQDKMSDLISRTAEISPFDNSFWSKYIKNPNRVHNEFAQRYVIQECYFNAYTKLLDDYPVESTEENPLTDHDIEINTRAREIIQVEIDESRNKMEVYKSISDLDLLKELYANLEDRYMHGVKMSHKFLIKEGIAAVDRIKRCKQNVPFPGYTGKNLRDDQMYKAFINSYSAMLGNYNTLLVTTAKNALDTGDATEEEIDKNVKPVFLKDVPADVTYKMFATILLILMGRVVRKLATHECSKYDAIVLDSYFQMFCHLATDIYIMSEVWELLSPLVVHLINTVKLDQKW